MVRVSVLLSVTLTATGWFPTVAAVPATKPLPRTSTLGSCSRSALAQVADRRRSDHGTPDGTQLIKEAEMRRQPQAG